MRVGIRRINLVQFGEGKFGVRYGWVFHTYQDFSTPCFEWGASSPHFEDCVVSEAAATELFNQMTLTKKLKVLK